jgi:hypothetical protein
LFSAGAGVLEDSEPPPQATKAEEAIASVASKASVLVNLLIGISSLRYIYYISL